MVLLDVLCSVKVLGGLKLVVLHFYCATRYGTPLLVYVASESSHSHGDFVARNTLVGHISTVLMFHLRHS